MEMIDCPVCDDSYDTQAEADACCGELIASGAIVKTPDGNYAYAEDVLDENDNWL
jgi:hypothetical protein